MATVVLRSEATLKDEQLRAIGCVAVEAVYLEDFLDEVIEKLCCLDEPDFRLLIAGAQLTTKLNVVKTLTENRIDDEFKDRHKKLFETLKQRITDRNIIVHGTWHVDLITGVKNPDDPEGRFKWVPSGDSYAMRNKRGEPGHTKHAPDIMEIARGIAQGYLDLIYFLSESKLYPPRHVRSERQPQQVIKIPDSTSKTTTHRQAHKPDGE